MQYISQVIDSFPIIIRGSRYGKQEYGLIRRELFISLFLFSQNTYPTIPILSPRLKLYEKSSSIVRPLKASEARSNFSTFPPILLCPPSVSDDNSSCTPFLFCCLDRASAPTFSNLRKASILAFPLLSLAFGCFLIHSNSFL